MEKLKTYTIIIIILLILVVLYFALTTLKPFSQQATNKPACTHSWVCNWGPCVNGQQGQVAVDANNCKAPINGQIACPATTRACK